MKIIPTSTAPFYEQVCSLDGVDYTLRFRWSQRESRWYLDIPGVLEGVKIVANFGLLGGHVPGAARPPGEILAFAPEGDDAPPGLEELGAGKRVVLLYLEESDFV